MLDMFGSPRITTKQLAGLCRRLGITLHAGIDLRTVLARECDRAVRPALRARLAILSDRVNHGSPLAEAVAETEDFFPPLFREMVKVGDETGQLAEVCGQLADHYEGQLRIYRDFLSAISWPLIEFALSIVLIGFLIWIQGILMARGGAQGDILKIGLAGTSGLIEYCLLIGAIGFAAFLVIRAIRRGSLWTAPLQRLVIVLPGIGPPTQTICLARIAWTMHLTFNTGMSIRRAIRLCLASASNAYYTDQTQPILKAIDQGESLAEAFASTGKFPVDFLDALHVADESGRVVEAMGHLADQYRERAAFAFRTLGQIASWAVYAVIVAFITCAIFRVASFYIGGIQQASQM
jgi:type II secretory pathway component PulF